VAKLNALDFIKEKKVIAIVRGADGSAILPIADALHEGGIRLLEITLNSPNAFESIKSVKQKYSGDMLIGAGTVLDPESAQAALASGAEFILSPTVNVDTIKLTKRYGGVSIPGAFTPSEILTAFEHGGDIIKVFPASAGPGYIKNILGPLPQIPLLPTGGVNLGNIAEFMKAGAVGVGLGSALVHTDEPVTDSYLSRLTVKAKEFIEAIK
jgi:2-dehydro-3-deoxyphosphogluconate aldolase/(4S)-4-hydroxy-2-oxoglutarate aldolase